MTNWKPCAKLKPHEKHGWKRGATSMSCPGVPERAGRVLRMGGQDYLDTAAIAKRLGVQVNTVQVYRKRSKAARAAGTATAWEFPEADATFGRSPVWLVSTIEAWEAKRPGTNTTAATAARRKGTK